LCCRHVAAHGDYHHWRPAAELYFEPPLAGQWMTLPNMGPEFDGARPIDAMIAGGLPKILRVRTYLDALRGGM
jgi:hypothetical protein